jgi:predicted PhzF superfamily epimerase YddE/YHI9
MKLPIFQIDAFSSQVFSGNPAAVIPLEYWLEDDQMQKIAEENNLSETAFFVDRGGWYQLRWFTPQNEVDLCGHATLASAYVILNMIQPEVNEVKFGTRSGELHVVKEDDFYTMDFPAHPPQACNPPDNLLQGLDKEPKEILASNYYLVVYDSEQEIRDLHPYMTKLKELDRIAVIVSAAGDDVDFVSRFFAPAVGIPEDPVTGSAHCTLIPYWAKKLNKRKLHARQISCRGGEIQCEMLNGRVSIAGNASLYMTGKINF